MPKITLEQTRTVLATGKKLRRTGTITIGDRQYKRLAEEAIEQEAAKEKELEPLVTMKARCPCGKRVTKLVRREIVPEIVMRVLPMGHASPAECETRLIHVDEDGNVIPDQHDYVPPKRKGKDYAAEGQGRG